MWVCGAGLSAVGLGLAVWVRYGACASSWLSLQARWCPFGGRVGFGLGGLGFVRWDVSGFREVGLVVVSVLFWCEDA